MSEHGQYTLTELFGWYTPMPAARGGVWNDPKECLICGTAVINPDTHQTFHNQLLP